jgi:hypothetical protein
MEKKELLDLLSDSCYKKDLQLFKQLVITHCGSNNFIDYNYIISKTMYHRIDKDERRDESKLFTLAGKLYITKRSKSCHFS